MSELQKNNGRKRRTTAPKTTEQKPQTNVTPVRAEETKTSPKRRAKVALPLDTQVCVVSAVMPGSLIYQSKRMQGMSFEWYEFGDEQYIELAELQAMRNSYPAFFEQNWILIDDEEVLEFLHAERFYKHIKSVDDLYQLLNSSAQEIKRVVPELSRSLKQTLAHLAKKHIDDGTLDSSALIRAIEDTTGFQFE